MKRERPLTHNQCVLVNYLWKFLQENHQLPPCQTISRDFGWSSPNAAQEKLDSLAAHGLLKKNCVNKWMFSEFAVYAFTLRGDFVAADPPLSIIASALTQIKQQMAAA